MASPRTEPSAPAVPATRAPLPPYVMALLVALPALLTAAVGLAHPVFLEPGTADRWQLAHLLLLPLFPLVGLSVLVLLRGARGPLAWTARLAAFAYAILYGALDSIAGVGAPQQVMGTQERGEAFPPIGDLYDIGDRLGHLGVLALAVAAVLTAVVVFVRDRSPLALAGGALAAAACYPFFRYHVFPPRGVLAMVGIGVGLGLVELARRDRSAARTS